MVVQDSVRGSRVLFGGSVMSNGLQENAGGGEPRSRQAQREFTGGTWERFEVRAGSLRTAPIIVVGDTDLRAAADGSAFFVERGDAIGGLSCQPARKGRDYAAGALIKNR